MWLKRHFGGNRQFISLRHIPRVLDFLHQNKLSKLSKEIQFFSENERKSKQESFVRLGILALTYNLDGKCWQYLYNWISRI